MKTKLKKAFGIRAALLLLITMLAGAGSAAAQSRSILELQTGDGMPLLVVDTSGTIVARGTLDEYYNWGGTRCEPRLPVTGAGIRFLWHPCKGAFRFGYLENNPTAWDDSDIDGVNFAAAQALERRTTELREEMERRAAEDQAEARAMRAEIERLRAEVSELRAHLAAFEALEERLARIEAGAGR